MNTPQWGDLEGGPTVWLEVIQVQILIYPSNNMGVISYGMLCFVSQSTIAWWWSSAWYTFSSTVRTICTVEPEQHGQTSVFAKPPIGGLFS